MSFTYRYTLMTLWRRGTKLTSTEQRDLRSCTTVVLRRPPRQNDALYQAVLRKTRGLVVDGALLKTGQFLIAKGMVNVVIIMRDPSHIIRASCRDPLHDGALFQEQHDRLFKKKNAVLKGIRFSTKSQDMLKACERQILQKGGSLGGVQHSLRHLDFVEPRFESFATPRRRYVCLLRAVAQFLAIKAGDKREKPDVRTRCEDALQAMTSKDCFMAGLAGDYGERCVQFLRLFDVHDHDPARTSAQLLDFRQDMRRLFVVGECLGPRVV